MSGHIINDFKDLRSLIGEITKDNPAKTTYQQNAEKMGYSEAEAKPKDDKGDRGIARTLGKKHAGEDDIKKAYMKLGRSAQGSVEHQRQLVQKQLAKMGFKTYSKFAFDNLFKFESNQMIAKWLINEEVLLESALSDMQDIVKNKSAKKIGGVMVDMFTASVITKAYDQVNDANKKKMEKANLQTLVKIAHKLMGMKEETIIEGGMKRLFQDLEDGASAQQISKKYGIDMKTAKSFVDDYKKVSQAPRLRAAENDPMKEGKYLKYSDLLLKKSRIIDKEGPDSSAVKAINKEIEKEKKKLGIREDIQEGTWAVPDSKDKMKSLNKLMKKSLIIKGDKDASKASKTLGNIIGDDGVEDEWLKMASEYKKGSAAMDARDAVVKFLTDWGFTVKNYQITHYPESILEDGLQERGNLKKPKKGKLLKLDNEPSRETKLKEERDHAKQSPFKLKSQAYPRAIAVNTDGFGHRHATVEDIIAACDSFGMILDKELQVEQIQKQLGKKGFISFKQTDLEDVFEARETERIILTLESTVEKQVPIGYTKNEITEAYIMGEEIEFLKPDGFKTVGPVLKKSGNTYNVKDKFTGKSYTYKYIGETEVKTFKEVSSINEARFSKQLIKQAGGIAFDKRYYMGNMSGAIKAIEKLKKGLSDDPKVREMLRIANEDNLNNIDEYIKADGTRRRVHASDQRLKGNNKIKEGDKEEYEKFFDKALKKFGVSSPAELEGEKKKEFFDYIDKNWKGDHEEVDVHSSYKVDGRRKNFREKMRKLGYIKAAR